MTVSEARRRANDKWKANNMKRIPLDVRIEEYEQIRSRAEQNHEAVNGYIRRLVKQDASPCINIPLEQQTIDKLRTITEKNNTTITELITKAVTTYIEKHKQD
jgi:hypothetical protein